MPEFTGTYTHTLDGKGRVSVPAAYRRQLTGEGLHLNLGLDGCLIIYPPEKWEAVKRELSSLSRGREAERFFLRRFARFLRAVSLDAQGRIMIPAELLEKAEIDSEVVFLGQLDSIELWAPEKFASASGEKEMSFEQVAEDLGIDI
jgi:MraZ protein